MITKSHFRSNASQVPKYARSKTLCHVFHSRMIVIYYCSIFESVHTRGTMSSGVKSPRIRIFARKSAVAGLVCLFLTLYLYGAIQQLSLVNTKMGASDQGAYMTYAKRLRENNYNYAGDRNRMPLYPFLQSLHYRSGMPDEQFFSQGKYVNVIISFLALGGVYLIIRGSFSGIHTLTFLLVTAFTVFVFKAGFFQAEILYYFETFLIFVLLLRLFDKPSYYLAVLVGILFGLAHLTKASIIPLLILFVLFAGAKSLVYVYRKLRSGSIKNVVDFSNRRQLLTVPLVVLFFLVTIFPYIRTSKRIFGQYFYNVNSTFYIWYDSWEEAKQGTRAHGDRVGWPEMPPEEIPSLSKYLRDHTGKQIVDRFWNGIKTLRTTIWETYGYGKYVVFFVGLLTIVAIWQWRQVKHLVAERPFQTGFVTAYLVCYILLIAWYTPIGGANRLILALFLPLLYVVGCSLRGIKIKWALHIGRHESDFLLLVNLFVLAVILVDIYFILTQRIVVQFGGR